MTDHEGLTADRASSWLAALDPDPETAERCYQELLRDLTRFLEWQHPDPETAAQETMFRGLPRLAAGVVASPAGARGYLFGIAKKIALEGGRLRRREPQLDIGLAAKRAAPRNQFDGIDARIDMARALSRLSAPERRLFLRYYGGDPREAICGDLGVTPGHLRVLVFRLRRKMAR